MESNVSKIIQRGETSYVMENSRCSQTPTYREGHRQSIATTYKKLSNQIQASSSKQTPLKVTSRKH